MTIDYLIGRLNKKGRDKTLQDKNKKNLYKILFIAILLGFIISLAGCSWLSLGLLNIIDPQAQIRVNYTDIDLTEGEGTIALEIYSLNEVEFIGSGFSYKYYSNNVLISDLTKTVGATFYVEPSTTPGTPGPITTIDLPLYYQEAQDYVKLNPLITEITCTISLIGIDGSGHNITKSVIFDLPALQPGVDVTPPEAIIIAIPTTGNPPLTVAFDASSSCDKRNADDTCDKEGIASYGWDFGDGTTSTAIATTHTYENAGTFIVTLTVTDLFGNQGIAIQIITVGTGVVGAVIVTTPSPATGFVPFTVGFDASGSTVEKPPIVSYAWDFNDGTIATGITAVHKFTTVGTYLVQLTVTDSAANVYVAFVTVIANKAP
jgi:PKD repeat protein